METFSAMPKQPIGIELSRFGGQDILGFSPSCAKG
jgi:hypothetical protein